MSTIVQDFKNSLDINKIKVLDESIVKNARNVNDIVHYYGILKPPVEKVVSIRDIVGYDNEQPQNIVETIDDFFNDKGDAYHTRSNTMLTIPEDQIIQKLGNSFKIEPISLKGVGGDLYNIYNNGLHRFTVLKLHYLNELAKFNPTNTQARDALAEKYSFKAEVREVDYVKTYSSYMLSLMCRGKQVQLDLDKDYNPTGKAQVIDYENEDNCQILTDDELTQFVCDESINFWKTATPQQKERFEEEFTQNYNRLRTFREFVDQKLTPLMSKEKK